MASHQNFYTYFTTFQNNVGTLPQFIVPAPPALPYFRPLPHQNIISPDQNLVQTFEAKISRNKTYKKPKKTVTITQVHEQLRNLVTNLNQLKEKEKSLQDKLETLSAAEWNKSMESITKEEELIKRSMVEINDTYIDTTKSALARRSAKRLRLKRVKLERRREKEDGQRQWKETDRKIDENLQKIKDDIDKAKQEEELKAQADVILREVSRKKQDAKKCIAKLESMLKLRKARENTAKGRGVSVSESDGNAFNNNIDKIKSLWQQKLALYETEEAALRAKLSSDVQRHSPASETTLRVAENLDRWREFLFGAPSGPQIDFRENVGRFVAVRCAWDSYVSSEGSPIPIGWVSPL